MLWAMQNDGRIKNRIRVSHGKSAHCLQSGNEKQKISADDDGSTDKTIYHDAANDCEINN